MTGTVSTHGVAPANRFDYWHDVICDAFVQLESEVLPSNASFHAEISSTDLGPLVLSRVRAAPHVVRRSERLIDDEPRDQVLVSMQISGTGIVAQGGRTAVLNPGDFALYDATQPYELTMPDDFEMLVLQFDRQFLLERCPSPEQLTAIGMSNRSQITAPVSSFLRSLEPIASATNATFSRQLATSALDLIGLALAEQFGDQFGPGAKRTKHFLAACTYINARSDDANLAPAEVAGAIGVSVGYLHQLFRDQELTVNRYLIRRRLSRCRDDLLDARSAGCTITDIAHSHGFKTSAHFTRCFVQQYGATPNSFRRGSNVR